MDNNNINDWKIRCSSLDILLTNDRSGKGLGVTAKKECVKLYAQKRYGRYEEISSKYLQKGTDREEDAITLLSLVNNNMYRKNSERLENDFVSGEIDIYLGESIRNADEIFDTKCSWSLFTFLESINSDNYRGQMDGYMWLSGAKKATVAYCLVNATAQIIDDEKRKAGWKFGADPDSHPEYLEKCKQIEINHIFDMAAFQREYPYYSFHNTEWKWDIPYADRCIQVVFHRDEKRIQSIQDRVTLAREYIIKNLFTTAETVTA